MIRFLIHRPVAVLMAFFALVLVSIFLMLRIPVSLMPETHVPRLTVEVTYANGSPGFIEKSILEPLRLNFQNLFRLKNIESTAGSGIGHIELEYDYGTNMQMAYLQVNEKIDQALKMLPHDLERPLVRRITPSAIPVLRVHLHAESLDLRALSDFAIYIVKRRFEQVKGVSLVEMNGNVNKVIRLIPRQHHFNRYGIDERSFAEFLERSNAPLTQVKVKEGNYVYDLTFENPLSNPEKLSSLMYPIDADNYIALQDIVRVNEDVSEQLGKHVYNGKEGIVFAIHKQDNESIYAISHRLREVLSSMESEYPNVAFNVTQEQIQIIDESIDQLLLSIILGTLLAFMILFLFSGEWKSPVLIGILIPTSLLCSIILFYLLDQTVNVVSLSGILLGIGVLIDNGIILIDNINEKRKQHSLLDSCRLGVVEIFPALVSSTLTTLSVFIPLVLLSGTAGILFQAQLISLGIVLTTSLVISLILLPVLYYSFKPATNQSDSKVFENILMYYQKTTRVGLSKFYVFVFLIILGMGALSYVYIPRQNLPEITRKDLLIDIKWPENIVLTENLQRVNLLIEKLDSVSAWTADLGVSSISEGGMNQINRARVYVKFPSEKDKEISEKYIRKYFSNSFPNTSFKILAPKNPYDQLFNTQANFATFKIRNTLEKPIEPTIFSNVRPDVVQLGQGFQFDKAVKVRVRKERLNTFGLSETKIVDKLKFYFGDQRVTSIDHFNETIPVVMRGIGGFSRNELAELSILVRDTLMYPVSYFISFEEDEVIKFIKADQAGIYQDLNLLKVSENEFEDINNEIRDIASKNGMIVSLSGQVVDIQENQFKLYTSILLAILLLYVILTAQFESFRLPVIILAEIPVSVSGCLAGLWVSSESLSVSSLIGIIITLGIIVNDSILKVDTILRHQKSGMNKREAIRIGGKQRLKPIIMTSLTTILALIPILFSSGLGSDIQKPLAVAVISGLFVGTLCSIYLVPMLYSRLK